MKKFAMVKPSRSEHSAPSEDVPAASNVSKVPNKYAEEVLKDALKKRFNEKFQLSNPKANKLKAKSPLDAADPSKKKLESFDLSEAQLEGLTKKFNQKNLHQYWGEGGTGYRAGDDRAASPGLVFHQEDKVEEESRIGRAHNN